MQKLEELRIDIMVLLNDREAHPSPDLIAVAERLDIVFKHGDINEWYLKEISQTEIILPPKKDVWKRRYSHIEWEDFNTNYIFCQACESYQEGNCICYTR